MIARPFVVLTVAALCGLLTVPSHAQGVRSEETRDLAGLRISLPDGVEVTTQTVDEGVEVIAITRGEEVCLLTVYFKRTTPQKALEVTLEELDKHVRKLAAPGSVSVKRVKLRMFNKWRPAHRLDYTVKSGIATRRMQAYVVAGPSRGRTVVASWSAPRKGISRAFSPNLIKSLRSLKLTK